MITDDFSGEIGSSGTEDSSFGWEKSQKNPSWKKSLAGSQRVL
jgi:hypothetical protein